MLKQVFADFERRLKTSIEAIGREVAKVRTGRASLAILDGITVEYYGTPTPLSQVARLSVPESSLIVVQPFDTGLLDPVDKAVRKADLGLNPINDGKMLRIPIPPLTEERRKELAKKISKLGEEGKTEIRHHRREANEVVKKLKENKEISEDEEHRTFAEIQKLTDRNISLLEEMVSNKEKEILKV